ncbi:MAG: hypothetical protein V1809_01065 [Planctomycetota bacterium]
MKLKPLFHSRRNRVIAGMALLVACMILVPMVVPMFHPWTELNFRHEEINIKTGQAHYTRYLWYVKISDEFRDTPLSVALQGERVDVEEMPFWWRVNTFSPGIPNSPHYFFHGALHQAYWFQQISESFQLPSEKRREIAKGILVSWQKNRNYHDADRYLQRVWEEYWKAEASDSPEKK